MKIKQREKWSLSCSLAASVTRKHNYLSGIQALQLEAGIGSAELDVLDQLISRASGLQAENFFRAK